VIISITQFGGPELIRSNQSIGFLGRGGTKSVNGAVEKEVPRR